MTDLERLELVIRRMHARRQQAHDKDGAMLNVDTQEVLAELADEIALQVRSDARSRT